MRGILFTSESIMDENGIKRGVGFLFHILLQCKVPFLILTHVQDVSFCLEKVEEAHCLPMYHHDECGYRHAAKQLGLDMEDCIIVNYRKEEITCNQLCAKQKNGYDLMFDLIMSWI